METKIFITSPFRLERDIDEWLKSNPDIYIIKCTQTQKALQVTLIVIYEQL